MLLFSLATCALVRKYVLTGDGTCVDGENQQQVAGIDRLLAVGCSTMRLLTTSASALGHVRRILFCCT